MTHAYTPGSWPPKSKKPTRWERLRESDLFVASSIIGSGALICIIFVVLVFGLPTYLIARTICSQQALQMQLPKDFGIFSGCMILVDNKWIPIESYRVIKLQQND